MTSDVLIEPRGNPQAMDDLIQSLPGSNAVLIRDPSGEEAYLSYEGCWVIRCFEGLPFLKFAAGHQGYFKIVRELEELL